MEIDTQTHRCMRSAGLLQLSERWAKFNMCWAVTECVSMAQRAENERVMIPRVHEKDHQPLGKNDAIKERKIIKKDISGNDQWMDGGKRKGGGENDKWKKVEEVSEVKTDKKKKRRCF